MRRSCIVYLVVAHYVAMSLVPCGVYRIRWQVVKRMSSNDNTDLRPSENIASLTKKMSEVVQTATAMWVNNGWQLRKRAGKWFPEIVQHGGEGALSTTTKALESNAQSWLASDAGARALTSPGLGEKERELALASEFRGFLARPEIKNKWRMEGESIIFENEEALSSSVALFALDVTKEIGAAARALARYVDDLEVELAAADEQSVRLRANVVDAERIAEEKSIIAQESQADAVAAKIQVEKLTSNLHDQERAARSYEKKARETSRKIVQIETTYKNSTLALEHAFERAAQIEAALADAEKKALQLSQELQQAERRAQTQARLAENFRQDRDAADQVVRALEKRAEAAEFHANQSAAELQAALLNTIESDNKLAIALNAVGNIDDLSSDDDLSSIIERDQFLFGNDDLFLPDEIDEEIDSQDIEDMSVFATLDPEAKRAVAADLQDARTTVRRAVQGNQEANLPLPSIWKMRKAQLAKELASYGRDPAGLKVNELRAAVRVERTKLSSSPTNDDDDDG
mmetsp:Transcript_1799/g.2743  ORF Transcript_1799/g.2743 Transcript_1799/m.2743 type:complete len:518 (-) Transcript_1799:409-1962(-)